MIEENVQAVLFGSKRVTPFHICPHSPRNINLNYNRLKLDHLRLNIKPTKNLPNKVTLKFWSNGILGQVKVTVILIVSIVI